MELIWPKKTTELWFIVPVSLSLYLTIKVISNLLSSSHTPPLPPGPRRIPIITDLLALQIPLSDIEKLLLHFRTQYGPIFTTPTPFRPFIYIADHAIAHQALVQNGAVFSDRPEAVTASKLLTSDQHDVNSSYYGPTWRALRRNLTSEMLHPARIKSFSGCRKWVVDILVDGLKFESESNNCVRVMGHLQYGMFCLLAFMCFGEKLDEKKIKEIEYAERRVITSFNKFMVLDMFPRMITKVFFRKKWQELFQLKEELESVLIPLIRERKKTKEEKNKGNNNDENNSSYHQEIEVVSYVDTLLELEWPVEKRKLEESEIVSLCSELLSAGTDTTATALQWIMANLVKYPKIQERVVEEIRDVIGDREEKRVKEEDLEKLSYLKAVILEGLRRHPPAHFVVPHAVTEDVVLNDYSIPKNGVINFLVAEIGRDPKVWEDPMEFRPERFLNCENKCEAFDIKGNKEIKMMPFGAGRRICPAYNVAMFHLEYFVANLVWNFEWRVPNDGDDVDLSEVLEFTVVMKNPLQARLSPRF